MHSDKKKRSVTFMALMIFTAALALDGAMRAQANTQPMPVKAKGLTIQSVIQMVKAGLSNDIIIAEIRNSHQKFNLTPNQLIELKRDKVNDGIIAAMLDPNPATTAAPMPAASPSLYPTDDGVYLNRQGKWEMIYPEIVNWKTGGIFKSFLSGGFVKGDINGHIAGGRSRYNVFEPVTFLIVLPHRDAITEYQLLRLHAHSDSREFRAMTGGVLHSSGGASHDAVAYTPRRVAPYTYQITLTQLRHGEYGFLPPGQNSSSMASSGMIYTFSVKE